MVIVELAAVLVFRKVVSPLGIPATNPPLLVMLAVPAVELASNVVSPPGL